MPLHTINDADCSHSTFECKLVVWDQTLLPFNIRKLFLSFASSVLLLYNLQNTQILISFKMKNIILKLLQSFMNYMHFLNPITLLTFGHLTLLFSSIRVFSSSFIPSMTLLEPFLGHSQPICKILPIMN